MKASKAAGLLRWAAVCCALFLAALRAVILKTAFDENGLLPVGSAALPLTVAACACVFAGLWALSTRLNRLPGTEACFTREPVFLACRLCAAVLVFFGALTALLDGGAELGRIGRLAAVSGFAAALAMLWTALSRERGRTLFWLRLIPALFTGAALILRFRNWSHDPMTIHIAPLLLAWTCGMVEMMLLTGFPLGAGHRRSGVLFGLAAGVFTCMAVPDYILGWQTGLSDLLTLLGVSLWCAEAAFSLLRRQVQEERPPAIPTETETLPEEQTETEAPAPEPAGTETHT